MTLDEIKDGLRRMYPDEFDEGDKNTQAQIVMLSALEVGPTASRLIEFTRLPKRTVNEFVQRLRNSGVFKKNKVYANWFDEELGGTDFMLDTLVATGMLERSQ